MKKTMGKRGQRISPQDIRRLRLSRNEIRVLQTVTFVPQKLVDIEKASKLAHATVYEVLLRLNGRGLVFSVGGGRARRWLIVNETDNNGSEGTEHKDIRILQGREELLSVISELFVTHKGGRLLSFHGEKVLEGWLSLLERKDIEQRNAMIMDSEIIVERFVPEHGYERIFRSFPDTWRRTMLGRAQITYFLPDELFESSTELLMFSDVVIVYETHLSRMILLRDKETIRMYSVLFEMMRRLGRKINSEEVFGRYLER